MAAVERVCEGDVDLLGSLVDKSLLVFSGGRYRMLETIREYGLERLAESGETEPMRRALASWLLDLAATADGHLRGPDQLVWRRRIGAEHDNLHAAVRSAIAADDAPGAVALCARLGWYWWISGHRAEALALTRDALEMTGVREDADRAVAYTFAALNGLEGVASMHDVTAFFREAQRLAVGREQAHPTLRLLRPLAALFQGGWEADHTAMAALGADPDPWLRAVSRVLTAHMRLNFGQSPDVAEKEMRAALAGFREIGERWGIGFTLSALGDLAAARGDFGSAVTWQREAITLVREVGLREDIPQMQVKLASQLWMGGEHDEARRQFKLARQSAEEVGLPEVTASVEYGLAMLARLDGDLPEARDRMTAASRAMAETVVPDQFRAMVAGTRGMIEAEAGDGELARRLHEEAIRLGVTSRDSPVVAIALLGWADLALREADPARAARLLGASDGVRGSKDLSLPDAVRLDREARAALGDPGFEAAYREGVPVTVQSALAAVGLHPAPEGPDGERGEDRQQPGRPQQ